MGDDVFGMDGVKGTSLNLLGKGFHEANVVIVRKITF